MSAAAKPWVLVTGGASTAMAASEDLPHTPQLELA